jgi:hypothetical protein
MTGRNPTDTSRPATSRKFAAFDAEVDYEIVEGELLPRTTPFRPWDPAVEFL